MAVKSQLVIVESPAKARTIEKYLGGNFLVKASIGHVKDLPIKTLGVDVKEGFKPEYEVIKGKKKVIDEIRKASEKAAAVFLAPDPDREGEAIAWHVAEEIKRNKKAPPIYRVLFNEITRKAVQEAIKNPIELNQNMYEAQQARRILDRLVGYQISPVLWEKVRRGLSAGRVQSVAVRLVCEREEAIKAFKQEEYWTLDANLSGSNPPPFTARLLKRDGKKAEIRNEKEALSLISKLKGIPYVLGSIIRKEQKRYPSPPFITSTLQQEAARKLGFTAKKTMMIAQALYEGIEVKGEAVGLITYMRTDSVRIAPSAIDEARQLIFEKFGKDFIPPQANFYKSKRTAQDAHEAIRPTSVLATPDELHPFLKRDEFRLYELIWKRFVACQMAAAVIDRTSFVIQAGDCEFRATGSVIKFPGFISVYLEGIDEGTPVKKEGDEDDGDDEGKILPVLKEGERLKLEKLDPGQHFTEPPPRYTEASLVKDLEEKGIGRPSTYASILSVIQDKKYVEKFDQRRFRPTDLGVLVNDLLVKNFSEVVDVTFTAQMEESLDAVERGEAKWKDLLTDFYKGFAHTLKVAKTNMRDVKRQEIPTDVMCEKCGSVMLIKFGRNGEFLACKAYPECRNTKEFRRDEAGKVVVQKEETTNEKCEKCGSPMIVKRGRFGKFLACSAYPNCKSTKAISIGINCPLCTKPLSERKTKKGRFFYGCTGYPNCKFASWDKPVAEKCPDCGSPYLVTKVTKSAGAEIRCPEKGCDYKRAA